MLGTDLEEAREDVKLEDRDVVVAGEVDGGLEGHGLQAGTDGVHFVKALSEDFPGHYRPERQHKEKVRGIIKKTGSHRNSEPRTLKQYQPVHIPTGTKTGGNQGQRARPRLPSSTC